MGMVRMIVPVVAGTVTPGVKMKTGETDDPTPLDVKAMEPKAAAATMAGYEPVTLAPTMVVPSAAIVAAATAAFAFCAAAGLVNPGIVNVIGWPPV